MNTSCWCFSYEFKIEMMLIFVVEWTFYIKVPANQVVKNEEDALRGHNLPCIYVYEGR